MAAMFNDFVKLAQVGCAIAEVGQQHLIGMAHLQGQGDTHRGGDAAADHAGGPQVAARDVGDVHRAAAPPAVARLLAQELGHHQRDVGPLGNGVAVAAMVVDNQVIRPERRDAAHRRSFLPNGEVHGAMDQAAHVQLLGFFLKVANLAHLLQHPDQLLARPFGQGFLDVGHCKVNSSASCSHNHPLTKSDST